MIELRWRKAQFHPNSLEAEPNSVMFQDFPVVLQYRVIKTGVDASGALNVFPSPLESTDWQDVEISDD